jgi:3-hydroxyacyl-[acyl-carrier-protein] dehydratase
MLMNELYTVTALNADTMHENIRAVIALNPEHPVFEGHFPGNPILPGVCTIQIVKEILELVFKTGMILEKAGNIKYLGFVSPAASPQMQFNLVVKENISGVWNCSATVSASGNMVCSFKGEYRSQ